VEGVYIEVEFMIKFLRASKCYISSKRASPDFTTFDFDAAEYALKDVDLQIEQGEFVFFCGPNGAGKTTLLKMINVMEKPTSGQVIIEGTSSADMSGRKVARLRRKIGMILQDLRLLKGRTVEENVRIVLEVSSTHRETHTARIVKILTYLDLLSKRDKYPPELSWGEQQKVSIARAIINHPTILLADEPTEKLDGAATDDIMTILRDVHLWGTTVLLASHDPDLKVTGAGRVVTLCDGEITSDVVLNTTTRDSR